jgi:hypothetical protein
LRLCPKLEIDHDGGSNSCPLGFLTLDAVANLVVRARGGLSCMGAAGFAVSDARAVADGEVAAPTGLGYACVVQRSGGRPESFSRPQVCP